MSSRNTCKRASSVNVEKQWPIPCVYCHDDNGAFLKNGKVEYGRHHVKDCMKTLRRKDSRGRRKKTFKKEVADDGSVWNVKVSKKKKKNRISKGAKLVLESAKNTFGVLGEIDEKNSKEDVMNEKFLVAEKSKTIPRASAPKKTMGGWLAVAKAKPKPKPNKEPRIEIPVAEPVEPKASPPKTTSPKRVDELKKEARIGYTPTPFKKKEKMSFSDIQMKFSNTDSWGDSGEEW